MCQYSTTLNAALTAIQTHLHQTIVTIRWIFWHYPGIVFEVEQASCYPLNLELGDDKCMAGNRGHNFFWGLKCCFVGAKRRNTLNVVMEIPNRLTCCDDGHCLIDNGRHINIARTLQKKTLCIAVFGSGESSGDHINGHNQNDAI